MATNYEEIINEIKTSKLSERGGRTMDSGVQNQYTLEKQKTLGYF